MAASVLFIDIRNQRRDFQTSVSAPPLCTSVFQSKLFSSSLSFEEEVIGSRSAAGGKSNGCVGKQRRRCYGAPSGAAGTWKVLMLSSVSPQSKWAMTRKKDERNKEFKVKF